MLDSSGQPDRNQPLGWFVGWAEKNDYRVVFARLEIGTQATETSASWIARGHLLADLSQIVGEPRPYGPRSAWPVAKGRAGFIEPARIENWYLRSAALRSTLAGSLPGPSGSDRYRLISQTKRNINMIIIISSSPWQAAQSGWTGLD